MLEMDFRQYDPALGRFFTIDAMAESQMRLSPYHFTGGNPVMFADPTGLKPQNPAYSAPRAFAGYGEGMLGYILSGGSPRDLLASSIYTPRGGGGGLADYAVPIADLPMWAQVLWANSEGKSTLFSGADLMSLVGLLNSMQKFSEIAPGLFYKLDPDEFKFENKIWVVSLDMEVFYQDKGTGLTDFQFVQTVHTNYPKGSADLLREKVTYNDPSDDGSPFYYATKEELAKHRQIAKDNGMDMQFYDGISKGRLKGIVWDAELSVVGRNGAGQYVPIYNITYGFDTNNGHITVHPVRILDEPTVFHLCSY